MRSTTVPPAQTTVTCNGCDVDVDINWLCKNCSASLCNICKAQHESNKFLNKHKIVPRTGREIRILESSEIIQPCQEHPTKETTGYCTTCDVPCCISCIEEWHQGHAFIAIEKKYIECEDQLNIMAMDLRKNEMTQMEQHIEELRQKLSSNEKTFEDIKTDINKFRRELKETVDMSCDKLVSEMEKEQTEQKTCINDVIKDSENQIQATEWFLSLCEDKIKKGGLDLLQFCRKPSPSNALSVFNIPEITPVFVPARDLIEVISQNIGEIRMEGKGGRVLFKLGTGKSRLLQNLSTSDISETNSIESHSGDKKDKDDSRRRNATHIKEADALGEAHLEALTGIGQKG